MVTAVVEIPEVFFSQEVHLSYQIGDSITTIKVNQNSDATIQVPENTDFLMWLTLIDYDGGSVETRRTVFNTRGLKPFIKNNVEISCIIK